MEKYKKELHEIAAEISGVKKSIEALEEKERMLNQFLFQHDAQKLVQRKQELLANLGDVL